VVDAVCPAILIYLALADRVFNPAFVSAAGWPAEATRWTAISLAIIGAGSLVRHRSAAGGSGSAGVTWCAGWIRRHRRTDG